MAVGSWVGSLFPLLLPWTWWSALSIVAPETYMTGWNPELYRAPEVSPPNSSEATGARHTFRHLPLVWASMNGGKIGRLIVSNVIRQPLSGKRWPNSKLEIAIPNSILENTANKEEGTETLVIWESPPV